MLVETEGMNAVLCEQDAEQEKVDKGSTLRSRGNSGVGDGGGPAIASSQGQRRARGKLHHVSHGRCVLKRPEWPALQTQRSGRSARGKLRGTGRREDADGCVPRVSQERQELKPVMPLGLAGRQEQRQPVPVTFHSACLLGKGSQGQKHRKKDCFSFYLFWDEAELSMLIS